MINICQMANAANIAKMVIYRKLLIRGICISLCLALSLTGGALAATKPVHPRQFFPYSKIPEVLRERLANQILGRKRIQHPALEDYYARISKELSPDDNFLIITSDNDYVNAFAFYGALVIVTRGMWEFAKTEDSLIGIIAHEMGHVKLNHFEIKKKTYEQASIISVPLIIAGILAGDAETRKAILIGGSGIITGQIYGLSRELEHEADVAGLQLLLMANRNGQALASILDKLSSGGEEYISTHPAPRRRAAYIQDRLSNINAPVARDNLEFLLLREILDVENNNSRFIRNRRKILASDSSHNKKTAAQFGLLLVATKKNNAKLGEEMQVALMDNEQPIIVAELANFISRVGDNHQQALAMLQTARSAHPHSLLLALRQLQTLRRAENYQQAINVWEKMPSSLQDRHDILSEISHCFFALKNSAQANLALTQSHIQRGNFELAKKQLGIAKKFDMDIKQLSRFSFMQKQINEELEAINKQNKQ